MRNRPGPLSSSHRRHRLRHRRLLPSCAALARARYAQCCARCLWTHRGWGAQVRRDEHVWTRARREKRTLSQLLHTRPFIQAAALSTTACFGSCTFRSRSLLQFPPPLPRLLPHPLRSLSLFCVLHGASLAGSWARFLTRAGARSASASPPLPRQPRLRTQRRRPPLFLRLPSLAHRRRLCSRTRRAALASLRVVKRRHRLLCRW